MKSISKKSVVILALFCLSLVTNLSVADEKVRRGYRLAPKAFRVAVDKVLPSMVMIETYGGVTKHSGKPKRGGSMGISKPGEGPTTGLIVSSDGYVVTSTFNFIKKPPIITVVFADGTRKVAKLKGRDETRKICILKIDNVKDLPVPKFVKRKDLQVGQWAISVGVGYGGDNPAVSAGIISATSRISGRAIQTDANISPANYGGPLIDVQGNVVGVCVPLSPRGSKASSGVEWYDSGIGFCIPLSGAEQLLARMKQGKNVYPGQLGVQVKPAKKDGTGVLITKISKTSAAEKAGLKKDDWILKVGNETVLDPLHLRILLGRYAAGDKVMLELKRNDKILKQEVTLAKIAARPTRPKIKPPTKKPPTKKPPTKKILPTKKIQPEKKSLPVPVPNK